MSLKDREVVSKNRCSLDIVREVLSVASVKVRKTKIMYGANLNFLQVEKYLNALLGNGLLERDGNSSYIITGAGLEFLQRYEEYLKRTFQLKVETQMNMKDKLQLERMCFASKNRVVSEQSQGSKT